MASATPLLPPGSVGCTGGGSQWSHSLHKSGSPARPVAAIYMEADEEEGAGEAAGQLDGARAGGAGLAKRGQP